MAYCNKCGKELENNQKFCHGCGKQVGEGSKPFQFKKIIFIVISVFILLIIFLFIFSDNRDTKIGNVIGSIVNSEKVIGEVISNEKEVCPYECCLEGEYKQKQCFANYECIDNQCIAIDSDKDGLTNIEEMNLGTNPQLYDSDGDTLSDYQEVENLGTNPLNVNTDSDRYDDNEDLEPTIKNTARIEIIPSNKEWNWDYVNILIAIVGGGVINPEIEIAKPSIAVLISNSGDDYAQYANFDVVFELQNTEINSKTISLNKMNIGESKTEIYSEVIKAGDIPCMLLNLVTEKSTDWDIKIRDLEYEKF